MLAQFVSPPTYSGELPGPRRDEVALARLVSGTRQVRLRLAAVALMALVPLGLLALDVVLTELCRAPSRMEYASIRQDWHLTWAGSLAIVGLLSVFVLWRTADPWLGRTAVALMAAWKLSVLFRDRVAAPVCLGTPLNETPYNPMAFPLTAMSALFFVLFLVAMILAAQSDRLAPRRRNMRH